MKKAFIIAVIIAAASFSAWKYYLTPATENGSYFEFAETTMGDLENIVSSTGTIEALNTVEIGTQVSGIISDLRVDFNDQVSNGQVLAVLDTSILASQVRDKRAALLRAEAQYEQAEAEYNRNKPLFEKGFISEKEFVPVKTNMEVTKASVMSAEVDLDRARINLDYAEIRSPIDGIIIDRTVEKGQTVAASFQTPTMFIVAEDLSRMQILADVDESDIGMIEQGMPVRFTVQAYIDKEFSGVVNQIRLQPKTEQNVVNYTVVVDADNDEGLLLPGMTATVDFIIEQVKNVILVSNSALRFEPSQSMMLEFRERTQNNPGNPPGGNGRMSGLGEGTGAQRGGERPDDTGMLWYVDDLGNTSMMIVRTGATDGINTEIIDTPEFKPGMAFIKGFTDKGKEVLDNEEPRMRGPRIF